MHHYAAGEYIEERLVNGQTRHYRRRRVLGKAHLTLFREDSRNATK